MPWILVTLGVLFLCVSGRETSGRQRFKGSGDYKGSGSGDYKGSGSDLTVPKYDGQTRLLNFTSLKQFERIKQKHEIEGVFFTLPKVEGDPLSENTWTINDYMLEVGVL